MTASISRWGTGWGIRVTKPVYDTFKFKDKERLAVEIKGNQIILTRLPETKEHLTLKECLTRNGWDGVTCYNEEEVDWGEPVGEEVW